MTLENLLKKQWKSCKVGTPPLDTSVSLELLTELNNEWEILDKKQLVKLYKFPNFSQALRFTNLIGDYAEKRNHHPEISLGWGFVKVIIWTHRINGLCETDFIWAANVENIYITNFEK